MNQPPLQCRIVRQTMPNLMLFAAPNLISNRTDSNAALLPYLTHQLGSAHEWSGVWNGPEFSRHPEGLSFSGLSFRDIQGSEFLGSEFSRHPRV